MMTFCLCTASCASNAPVQSHEPTDYVNLFIGASTNVGDAGSGYSNEHTTIEGFAFTQMSGVGWFGDLGNFLVMPTSGPLKKGSGIYAGRVKVTEKNTKSQVRHSAGPGFFCLNETQTAGRSCFSGQARFYFRFAQSN